MEVTLFSNIPYSSLNLLDPLGTRALEGLKEAALLMHHKNKKDDTRLFFHQVDLTYVDSDGDQINMNIDFDVM